MKLKPAGLLLGLGGNAAFAWGLYHLLGIGSCGGDLPPCPTEATPYFLAIPAGIIASVVATFLGGGIFAFSGTFAAVAVASLLRAANGGVDGDTTFPLVFGLGFAAATLLPVLLGALAVRGRRRAARLVAEGERGIATVLSVQDTGVTINDNPRVKLTVRIDPERGGAPIEGSKAITVPRVAIPRPGDRYPAWYDAQDPSHFGLGTDVQADAPADVRALFAKAAAPVPGEITAVPVAAPSAARQQEWVSELGRLNDLRLAGALTDEEFTRAKDKLLGGSPREPAGG